MFNLLLQFTKESKDINKKVNNTQSQIEKEHNHQLDVFERARKRFESHN